MKNFDVWSQNTKKLQVFASDNKWIRTQRIKIYNCISIQISARWGGATKLNENRLGNTA